MTTSATVLTAVIAAATAFVVAVVTQFLTWRRERTQRTYDRRRSALLDAQDTALAVRSRYGEFGDVTLTEPITRPVSVSGQAQRRLSDALAELGVRLSRVDDHAVVAAVEHWSDQARYHAISAEEVSEVEESQAWDAMNEAFGSALKSATGVSRAPIGESGARS
jgi:hypothetical protein